MERPLITPPEFTTHEIVERVALHDEVDPLELPPLFDAIDPDALEACIRSLDEGQVEFRYADHTVTVRSDGTVEIVEK